MLKTKIIASQITNLTDARYFAAWGVDYMGFCMDEDSENSISPSKVKEIKSWVEGPQFFGEFHTTKSKDYIEFMAKEAELDTVLLGHNIDHPSIHALENLRLFQEVNWSEEIIKFDHAEIVIWRTEQEWEDMAATDISFLRAIVQKTQLYLDLPFQTKSLDDILRKINPAGLLVRGSAEEKVGYKSYHDLDEFFEALAE
jgi:phosphoribosylanthranilate isomerase